MQAVILAAGRGTRMKELTESTPKSLLQVAGRSLLQYEFDALPDAVDEVIIIVGYLGGMIHDAFGPEYAGKRILYVEQEELSGTAAALWLAKDILKDKFIVMNGDDIYARDDITRVVEAKDWSLLVLESPDMKVGGKVRVDSQGSITDIVEGEHEGGPGLENAGVYFLDMRLFDSKPIPKEKHSPELGLPQTVLVAADKLKVPLKAVITKSRIQITSQEDLERAEELLKGSTM